MDLSRFFDRCGRIWQNWRTVGNGGTSNSRANLDDGQSISALPQQQESNSENVRQYSGPPGSLGSHHHYQHQQYTPSATTSANSFDYRQSPAHSSQHHAHHPPLVPLPTSLAFGSAAGCGVGVGGDPTSSSPSCSSQYSHHHTPIYSPVAHLRDSSRAYPHPGSLHNSLVSSSSQPTMPSGRALSSPSSSSSTPLIMSAGAELPPGSSFSAVQTPVSTNGFPRRHLSLNVQNVQRTNANSRLNPELRAHKLGTSAKAKSELIDTHSLSPRPRPKNLILSNSQDNVSSGNNNNNSSRSQRVPSIPLGPLSASPHHRSHNHGGQQAGSSSIHPHNLHHPNNPQHPFGTPPPLSGHSFLGHSQQQQSLFNNFSNIPANNRLKDKFGSTNYSINIGGKIYDNAQEDHFDKICDLGNGSFGMVEKMLHKPSSTELAVKKMRRSGNQDDNKHIINDLDLLRQCRDYPHIVQCYGYLIMETEVWIFMELMTICFDRLLKKMAHPIPEHIIGKIAIATVSSLDYLKVKHGVIHRDIKPSNILINRDGVIKLCDFGISGRLIDSKAHTRSVGCAAYMAPERIEPPDPTGSYDIRSDVWSLGLTLVELAIGRFPYQGWKSDFEILSKVITDPPPILPEDGTFSTQFCDFIKSCLTKDFKKRPKYTDLLNCDKFLIHYKDAEVDVAQWFNEAMDGPSDITSLNNHPPSPFN